MCHVYHYVIFFAIYKFSWPLYQENNPMDDRFSKSESRKDYNGNQ